MTRGDHTAARPPRAPVLEAARGLAGRSRLRVARALRSGAGGWAIWFAVAFGLFNAGLSHQGLIAVQRALNAGQYPGAAGAVRAYVTNDGDMLRYFAYVQAARGRPYQSYFVRSAEEWRRAFAAQEPFEPDERPTVSPGASLAPYRDFLVEYPPGFFLVALPWTWLCRDAGAYVMLFQSAMAACLTGAVLLLARARAVVAGGDPPDAGRLAAWAGVGALALGVVTTHRYDAAVAFAIALAAWALVMRRPAWLGLAVAVAIMLKGAPLVIVPLLVLQAIRARRPGALGRATLAALVAGALIALPAIVPAGKGIFQSLWYHLDRPVQIESTWGAVAGLWHAVHPGSLHVEKTFGSTNVVGPGLGAFGPISQIVTVAGLLAVYGVTWRRLDPRAASDAAPPELATLEGFAAALAVFIACGRVCSPQYLVWLLPLGVMLSLTSPRRVGLPLLVTTFALTQVIYPIGYGALEALRPWACALVLLRNLLLLIWARVILGRDGTAPLR